MAFAQHIESYDISSLLRSAPKPEITSIAQLLQDKTANNISKDVLKITNSLDKLNDLKSGMSHADLIYWYCSIRTLTSTLHSFEAQALTSLKRVVTHCQCSKCNKQIKLNYKSGLLRSLQNHTCQQVVPLANKNGNFKLKEYQLYKEIRYSSNIEEQIFYKLPPKKGGNAMYFYTIHIFKDKFSCIICETTISGVNNVKQHVSGTRHVTGLNRVYNDLVVFHKYFLRLEPCYQHLQVYFNLYDNRMVICSMCTHKVLIQNLERHIKSSCFNNTAAISSHHVNIKDNHYSDEVRATIYKDLLQWHIYQNGVTYPVFQNINGNIQCLLCAAKITTDCVAHFLSPNHAKMSDSENKIQEFIDYHEVWMAQPPAIQLQQTFFRMSKVGIFCNLCNLDFIFLDLYGHVQSSQHMTKVFLEGMQNLRDVLNTAFPTGISIGTENNGSSSSSSTRNKSGSTANKICSIGNDYCDQVQTTIYKDLLQWHISIDNVSYPLFQHIKDAVECLLCGTQVANVTNHSISPHHQDNCKREKLIQKIINYHSLWVSQPPDIQVQQTHFRMKKKGLYCNLCGGDSCLDKNTLTQHVQSDNHIENLLSLTVQSFYKDVQSDGLYIVPSEESPADVDEDRQSSSDVLPGSDNHSSESCSNMETGASSSSESISESESGSEAENDKLSTDGVIRAILDALGEHEPLGTRLTDCLPLENLTATDSNVKRISIDEYLHRESTPVEHVAKKETKMISYDKSVFEELYPEEFLHFYIVIDSLKYPTIMKRNEHKYCLICNVDVHHYALKHVNSTQHIDLSASEGRTGFVKKFHDVWIQMPCADQCGQNFFRADERLVCILCDETVEYDVGELKTHINSLKHLQKMMRRRFDDVLNDENRPPDLSNITTGDQIIHLDKKKDTANVYTWPRSSSGKPLPLHELLNISKLPIPTKTEDNGDLPLPGLPTLTSYSKEIVDKLYNGELLHYYLPVNSVKYPCIQNLDNDRKRCLICNVNINDGVLFHINSTLHVESATNPEKLSNLEQYHSVWMNIAVSNQYDQRHFNVDNELFCVPCQFELKYDINAVTSHLSSIGHKERTSLESADFRTSETNPTAANDSTKEDCSKSDINSAGTQISVVNVIAEEAQVLDTANNVIKMRYFDVVLDELYPDSKSSEQHVFIDDVEYPIFRKTIGGTRCMLCKRHPYIDSVKDHMTEDKHKARLANRKAWSKFKKFHKYWMQQTLFVQQHQKYFEGLKKCIVCGIDVENDLLVSHVRSDKHMMNIRIFNIDGTKGHPSTLDGNGSKSSVSKQVGDTHSVSGINKIASKQASNTRKKSKHQTRNAVFQERSDDVSKTLPLRFIKHVKFIIADGTNKRQCTCCEVKIENNISSIKEHLNSANHSQKSGIINKKFKYCCVMCNKRYGRETSYDKHLLDPTHIALCKIPQKEQVAEFECLTCNTVIFGNVSSLPRHMLDMKNTKKPKQLVLSKTVLALFTSRNTMRLIADKLLKEANQVSKNQEEERAVCTALVRVLKEHYPSCKAYPFGSRVTGLGYIDSDLDVFLDIGDMYFGERNQHPDIQASIVTTVAKALKKSSSFSDINKVARARTPIVQVFHKDTGIDCDISFRHALSVENTAFISLCLDLQPILRPTLLYLKEWNAALDITGLSSYALTILMIFYLQSKNYLLSVNELRMINQMEGSVIDGWATVKYSLPLAKMKKYVEECRCDVVELMEDFFEYYSKFDYETWVICPLMGYLVSKKSFDGNGENLPVEMKTYVEKLSGTNGEYFRNLTPICVQDPFDLSHNLTKACSKETVTKLQTYCALSKQLLSALL